MCLENAWIPLFSNVSLQITSEYLFVIGKCYPKMELMINEIQPRIKPVFLRMFQLVEISAKKNTSKNPQIILQKNCKGNWGGNFWIKVKNFAEFKTLFEAWKIPLFRKYFYLRSAARCTATAEILVVDLRKDDCCCCKQFSNPTQVK